MLGACDRLEREGFRVVAGRRPTRDGVVDLDALAAALDDAHRGRVGDARQQRDRRAPAARRGRARSCASARRARSCTPTRCRRRSGSTSGRATADVDARRDLGPQVRRPEGRRRAVVRDGTRARAAHRGRRPRAGPARRHAERRRASSRSRPRCASPTSAAPRRRRASRALRDGSSGASRAQVAGLHGQRRPRRGASPGSCTARSTASRPRRCSSRSTSRA